MSFPETTLERRPSPALLALLDRQCFADAWDEDSWRGLLTGAALHAWALLEPNGEPLGLLAFQRVIDEVELLRVGIVSARRGTGLGRRLLGHLLDYCGAEGVQRVWLEVRVSNRAAQRLYEAAEFDLTGRRPGYYRSPPEDALVYAWAAD